MENEEFDPRPHLFPDELARYDTVRVTCDERRREVLRLAKALRKIKARARARRDRGVGPAYLPRTVQMPMPRLTEEDLG
jgi:hypothetical protein